MFWFLIGFAIYSWTITFFAIWYARRTGNVITAIFIAIFVPVAIPIIIGLSTSRMSRRVENWPHPGQRVVYYDNTPRW